jgi:hypothetical protein
MTQTFVEKIAFMTNSVSHYYLNRAWMWREEFERASVWLAQFSYSDAHWDYSSWSHINNVQYPARVYFDKEADFLVFKLMFPNLVKV